MVSLKSDCDTDDESNLTIALNNPSLNVQNNVNDNQNDDSFKLCSDGAIEHLWSTKTMGNHGPEELLVSLWYFITHNFGLSSRIDHAKLCMGHIRLVVYDNQKTLVFNRDFQPNIKFNTRFPSKIIHQIASNPTKCPVTIYEAYISRRPSNFCYEGAPFYLQPDKSVHINPTSLVNIEEGLIVAPWFSAAGLGKNRIGGLFNAALLKSGQPSKRHYVSRRQIPTQLNTSPVKLTVSPIVNNDNNKSNNNDDNIRSNNVTELPKPKIRLKISHLNSGNPIVTTETVNPDNHNEQKIEVKEELSCKRKPIVRQESVMQKKKIKTEPIVKERFYDEKDFSIQLKIRAGRTLNHSNSLSNSNNSSGIGKRRDISRHQKSIITVTSSESDPVLRQVMMQLGMVKDSLLCSTECKNRRSLNRRNSLKSPVAPPDAEQKRQLRNQNPSLNPIKSHINSSTANLPPYLPILSKLWPLEFDQTIFTSNTDKEIQKLMSYSFEISSPTEEEESNDETQNCLKEPVT